VLGELSRRDDDNENRRTGPGFYRKRRVSRAQSLYASARIENRREAVTTIRDGRGKQGNVLSDRSSIPPSCGLPTPTPTAARAVSEPTSVTFARFEHPSELVCRVSSARGPRLIGPSQMLRSLMNVVAPSQYPDGDTITGGFTGGPGDPVPSTFLRPPSKATCPTHLCFRHPTLDRARHSESFPQPIIYYLPSIVVMAGDSRFFRVYPHLPRVLHVFTSRCSICFFFAHNPCSYEHFR